MFNVSSEVKRFDKKKYICEKMILKEDVVKMNLCEIKKILKWSTHLRHTP